MTWRRLLEWDADVSARLRIAERPGWLRSCAIALAHSGDSWLWWPGLALAWWAGSGFWRSWAAALLGGTIILAAFVMATKFSIRRPRPEGEWGGLYRRTDPHAFPSGHAARVFAIAAMAAGLGPWWMAVALGIWAPLVCLARVAMGVHYVSDVVAGAMLGAAAGGLMLAWDLAFRR